eukprot:3870931-Amphidinium_carterae.1
MPKLEDVKGQGWHISIALVLPSSSAVCVGQILRAGLEPNRIYAGKYEIRPPASDSTRANSRVDFQSVLNAFEKSTETVVSLS